MGCASTKSEVQSEKVEESVHFTECSSLNDGACVDSDEEVTLFNSYAYYDKDKEEWTLQIQGWIYEPDYSSEERSLFITLIEAVVGSIQSEPSFLDERISPFLVDNEGNEKIIIKLGERTYSLNKSNDAGQFSDEITLSNEEVQVLSMNNILTYSLVLPKEDTRNFQGHVFLLKDEGTMIISDIDDTIKISEVYLGNEKIIDNTFLQTPLVADSMQALYQQLQTDNSNVTFHYLSGSPWQLYNFVHTFVVENTFSEGTFHLKELRVNPLSSSLYNFLDSDSTYNHKVETLTQMMQNFPQKQFILIGDSGEKDPEVYGYIQANYPSQVKSIYIRNVTNETSNSTRMKEAFGSYSPNVTLIDI